MNHKKTIRAFIERKDGSFIVNPKIKQLERAEQLRTVRVVVVKESPEPEPITVRVRISK